jgi:hypoxia up-regulated 1
MNPPSRQRAGKTTKKNMDGTIMTILLWRSILLACLSLSSSVSARAILGIDLGSSYVKVALVRPGSPLEIVTNLHSKRKTEQLILFDNGGQRFYGADAAALLARKSGQTAAHVSLALGRDDVHAVAKVRGLDWIGFMRSRNRMEWVMAVVWKNWHHGVIAHSLSHSPFSFFRLVPGTTTHTQVLPTHHHPIVPSYNETRYGLSMSIITDAKKNNITIVNFTPEELIAMVLSHAHEIAVKYAAESGGAELKTIKDCVITVPSFLTDAERRSYLDAAHLAGLNVLILMDETVAAAVQYAMDKTFDDGPVTMLFYNMGAVSTQVAIVKFEAAGVKKKPIVTVLAKAWDETLGGAAFDHVIVEHIVESYNAKRPNGIDVRTDRSAMTKLRIEANKIKHVLSANNEQPVRFDHDDISVSTIISRRKFEELCHDLLQRVAGPVTTALQRANLTRVDAVELLGGGTRVPAVPDRLAATVLPPPLDLGKHMNGDEAMALGSAFVGANYSTAFRVRQIGLVDIHPYGVQVHIENYMPDTATTTETTSEPAWSKSTTIFKPWGKTGVKKSIAFSHDQNVQVELLYDDGTSLERYNITGIDTFAAAQKKELGKPKVSLSFELGTSGITRLVKAEASVEEMYTVEEEIEVEDDVTADDNDADAAAADNATTTTGDAGADTASKEEGKAKEEKTKLEKEETTTKETVAANATNTTNTTNAANATNTTDAATNATKAEATPKKKMKKVKVEKVCGRFFFFFSSPTAEKPSHLLAIPSSGIRLDHEGKETRTQTIIDH